jgi:hypothetical protein
MKLGVCRVLPVSWDWLGAGDDFKALQALCLTKALGPLSSSITFA